MPSLTPKQHLCSWLLLRKVSDATLEVHIAVTVKLVIYCDFSVFIIDHDEIFPYAS